MRRCCLAVSSVLILHQGFSFAQHLDSSRKLDSEPPPGWDLPNKLPADDDKERGGKTFGFWASGEYLLRWTKNGRIPPVITSGGNGLMGSRGTRVLVDNLEFDNDVRQGARFALGYDFAKNSPIGLEASYFFLVERQSEASFSSDGTPLLAQPFTNAALGKPDATLVAAPSKRKR